MDEVRDSFRSSTWGWLRGTLAGIGTILLAVAGPALLIGMAGDAHRAAFAPGAHYWQLWPELDVRAEDAVIEKCRFSAFTPGASGLDALLRGLGIDTVIVTGTLTNCCCESTARDAMQLNYRVLLAADANAALSDEEHAATLQIMALVFADLHSTDELVELMKTPALAG